MATTLPLFAASRLSRFRAFHNAHPDVYARELMRREPELADFFETCG